MNSDHQSTNASFFFILKKQPIFCELIKKVGTFCSKKGTVICRVRLDRGGYVPGESIMINARVENHSRITLKSAKATLNETIKYLCDGKIIHTEHKELASLERGKFDLVFL